MHRAWAGLAWQSLDDGAQWHTWTPPAPAGTIVSTNPARQQVAGVWSWLVTTTRQVMILAKQCSVTAVEQQLETMALSGPSWGSARTLYKLDSRVDNELTRKGVGGHRRGQLRRELQVRHNVVHQQRLGGGRAADLHAFRNC